jgi:hypothetical protein
MSPRYATLCLEELDDRIVPSVTAAHTTLPVMVGPIEQSTAIMQPGPSPGVLTGNGQGQYVRELVPGAQGGRYAMQGSADLGDMGKVSVKGFVQSPGGIGHAYGTLTLTNANGSVTLRLQGPQQTSLSAIPNSFQFQVISGTGAYSNFTDQGTLDLTLTATSSSQGTFSFSTT